LETTNELEFQIVKEQLEVSDSVPTKHLKVLKDKKYKIYILNNFLAVCYDP